MKKALITGITGQDGSYLAEFLLEKGYAVYGMTRRTSSVNTDRIQHLNFDPHDPNSRLHLISGDLADYASLCRVITEVEPDEVYNLAAQSHVKVSFELPEQTADVVALGTQRMLEALKQSGSKAKFYQASSSEMFGNHPKNPIQEGTPFRPCSPYATSKVFAYWTTVNYRESYGIFACNGILFNHESPRRGENFVTRKITLGVASIVAGKQKVIHLGNLDSKRDWGYAPDYVQAMWLMLQQDKPDDYIVATGEGHSVKEFLHEAFAYVGLDWQKHVNVDPRYFRPHEVHYLLGDASRAKDKLGWSPSISFKDLVHRMVEADLERVARKDYQPLEEETA